MYVGIARGSHALALLKVDSDMAGRARHRGFGHVRRLPSKRYQASYVGPDLQRHTAPSTFDAKLYAEGWLATEQGLIAAGTWIPPKVRAERTEADKPRTFGDYATVWLGARELKPRTRSHYASLLAHQLTTWSSVPVEAIRPDMVREWHNGLDRTRPTTRAHAYGLLRAILTTAVSDGLISANPCHIRGAGTSKRVKKIRPATLAELELLVAAMPAKYRAMTLLASWCGLRFGELVELRRSDVDLDGGRIHVRRGAVRVDGAVVIGTPKSEAGIRDVAIPPHLIPVLRQHVRDHAAFGRDGLLFPAKHGGTLAPSTLYKSFYRARAAAGRPDLRWHDLRHTGAVLAAATGATLAELMGRLGHSTAAAAMR